MMTGYHRSRLPADARREVLWQALWQHHFSRKIRPDYTVLDLGCGYGSFINSVAARCRIAVDTWEKFPRHLKDGIDAHVGPATDLGFLPDGGVDYVLASNLFEHLPQSGLVSVLDQLRTKLSRRGSLTLLQPNYRYAFRHYFDDYTHVTAYLHVSLADLLQANGYEILEAAPRFLPLTVKSRLPVSSLLVGAYLRSPFKPFGAQMMIHARPA